MILVGILSILILFVKNRRRGEGVASWTKSVKCDESYLSTVPKMKLNYFSRNVTRGKIISFQHGCTKLPNLEMESKCLTKSDVQLIPDISRTKNDKRIL